MGKGKYHSIVASVPKQYTEPSAEQLKKIDQDKALKEQLHLPRVTPEREWAGSFHSPAKAQISDVFGTSRTFNGRVQSVHQGLDYAVPEGTPVAALNSGTVLLAQSLFFEGNCVVLDHGQGLLTLYMHLSKIEVKEGDDITGGAEDRVERRNRARHRTSPARGGALAGCLPESGDSAKSQVAVNFCAETARFRCAGWALNGAPL